ncbi:lactonase family protein [Clostridium paraputrificum]|uniref:lactonase family protein n=1 Tax=Clostridium paraputrificum TaxID=29363 RepID=UPI003D32B33F
MNEHLLKGYIGTYTDGDSKGIYGFNFDLNNNKFTNISLSYEIDKPSYLAIDKNNNRLYSIAKINNDGGVAAFNINDDFSLNLINYNVEEGNPPCHISLSNDKNFLFSANYHENKIISYSLNGDGSLNPKKEVLSHDGDNPHIHYVSLDPGQNFLYSLDLGLDKMNIYEFKNGSLLKRNDLTIPFSKGCGPRHMAFHPTKRYAYVLTESSSEIAVFKYDTLGKLNLINVLSTLPNKYCGVKSGAAIHIHPNGQYLYTSNRGHNSISIFAIDEETSNLTLLGHQSTFGSGPRDFSISQDGKYLMVANQDTSSIVAFSIDYKTGMLNDVLDTINVPNPVCLKFL